MDEKRTFRIVKNGREMGLRPRGATDIKGPVINIIEKGSRTPSGQESLPQDKNNYEEWEEDDEE